MNELMFTLFTICSFLIVYHFVGYSFIMSMIVNMWQKDALKNSDSISLTDKDFPSVEIIIPVRNEEKFVIEKYRNVLALQYPRDKLKISFFCNGCTDDSYEKVLSEHNKHKEAINRIKIVNIAERVGKISVINQAVSNSDADIIVLTDVSATIPSDALFQLLKHFQVPAVGVVCPSYRLADQTHLGEISYWNYQTKIKTNESKLGGSFHGHGAFYCFRRELFEPLPSDTINDDVIIPGSIVIKGYRVVYDNSVHALELAPTLPGQDFLRRVRISAGNVQQVFRLIRLLLPRYRWVAFCFFSGKVLRVLMPFCLLVTFASSLLLIGFSGWFAFIFAGQLLLYSAALLRHRNSLLTGNRWMEIIYYFSLGNLAMLRGSIAYACTTKRFHW